MFLRSMANQPCAIVGCRNPTSHVCRGCEGTAGFVCEMHATTYYDECDTMDPENCYKCSKRYDDECAAYDEMYRGHRGCEHCNERSMLNPKNGQWGREHCNECDMLNSKNSWKIFA